MTTRIQILRSSTAGTRPSSKQYGEPYVNFGDNQFGVFDSGNAVHDLLGVPVFSTTASYAIGQPVNYQGKLYIAQAVISPGAFNPVQWAQISGAGGGTSTTISDTPPSSPSPGSLWWESDTGILWIYYTDVNSSQWVALQTAASSSIVAGGISVNVRPFTASGPYVPSPGLISAVVETVAGGGAGGGVSGSGATTYLFIGAGGGSGGYSRKGLTASQIGPSQTITIGPGGTGANNANGSPGGDTSFGTLCIAKGGSGGGHTDNANVGAGGPGGVPGTGDVVAAGSPGQGSYFNTNSGTQTVYTVAGMGGSGPFGGGAPGQSWGAANTALTGLPGSNYGSGGAGASTFNAGAGIAPGGPGSPGICIVTEFIAVAGAGSLSGAGAMVLISSQTVSGAASVDFTSLLTNQYAEYEVRFDGVYTSSNADTFLARIGKSGVYQAASSYYFAGLTTNSSGSNASYGSASATSIQLSYAGVVSSAAQNAISGKVRIPNPSSTTVFKPIRYELAYFQSAGPNVANYGDGVWTGDTNAIDSIRFLMATGTITGTFRLYGIRGTDGAGPPAAFTVGGVLSYVSATALSFVPKNGGYTIINGAALPIPSAGIIGLGNTGVYVNGISGQNLAASTTYYVYAFNNAGIITADFSTTVHATSVTAGNVGTEIKSGDDTRTLIGMIRTNASSQFVDTPAQRFVRSWFNTRRQSLVSAALAGESVASGGTWSEIATTKRVEFLKWATETVDLLFNGVQSCSTAGSYVASCIAIDGTAVSPECLFHSAGASYRGAISTRYTDDALSEGYHYGQMLGAGSNGQWQTIVVAGSGGAFGSRLTGFLGGP